MADRRNIATLITVIVLLRKKRHQRRQRSVWERQWLSRRSSFSVYWQLVQELRLEDEENYRKYLRLDTVTFEELLAKVRPFIEKKNTNMRESISAEERLAVTLRYLATGETYSSLQYQFRISSATLSMIIPEVCQVIFEQLNDFLKCPKTPEEWHVIAKGFEDRWQLPHCVGAADGKHIKLLHPAHSGSSFYNYKGFYSIVLMAIVDADYKFLFADVGCQGRISDGGVLKNTEFWRALVQENLGLPEPTELPQSLDLSFDHNHFKQPVPYFFAGDEAFNLEHFMMKPYGQKNLSEEKRVFNYRLSRARRLSENVFGILSSRFRVFLGTICCKPDNAVKIVLAAIALHNFLREKIPNRYIPQGTVDVENKDGVLVEGTWRSECQDSPFKDLPNYRKGRQVMKAERMRDLLCDYVNGPGQIPWQWKALLS